MKMLRDFTLATALMAALATPQLAAAPAANAGRDAVRRLADMPTPRAAHTTTLLADGRVLIVGGCRSDGCDEALSTDALLFDPSNGRFRSTSAPRVARVGHRAVSLKDGSVLLIGGWTANGVTASIERYVPATGEFEDHGSLLQARDGFTATALRDGTILIAGGYADGMRRLSSAERYDPRTKRSNAVDALATARMAHTATLLADGSVLIAGGSTSRTELVSSLERFVPETAKFESAGQLRKARHKHAAVRIGENVMILGGAAIPERDGHFADTELWNVKTRRVAPGPRMNEGRYKFLDTVVALADGRVLVAGGGRNAEALSADRRAFRQIGKPIAEKLAFATATRLADGRVLIVGGYDSSIRVSARAWAYE